MLRELSSAELTEHLLMAKIQNESDVQKAQRRKEEELAEAAITGVKKRKGRNGR